MLIKFWTNYHDENGRPVGSQVLFFLSWVDVMKYFFLNLFSAFLSSLFLRVCIAIIIIFNQNLYRYWLSLFILSNWKYAKKNDGL